MAPLRILISNDDGVFAEGIRTLAAAAASRGHRVTVVCPDQERSATGHGLTLQTPIRAERADELFADGIHAWACSGTPSDCVKLALFRLLEEWPDLVLSGINHGPNLGTDVLYSGTVSAAMEGTIEGLPALAVSSADYRWRHFGPAADLALAVAEGMLERGWPAGTLLNLNVPPLPAEQFAPLRWCRTAVRRYTDQFDRRTDPRGRTYYWLAGEVANDLEAAVAGPGEWPTDVAQVAAGGPSLTPLQPELFWRGDSEGLPAAASLSGG
ncbi:MAG: 5'/3'-nucleotidase SurE [Prochlorococcaceae cyanobacterium]|jgi:5'-nucleotidase